MTIDHFKQDIILKNGLLNVIEFLKNLIFMLEKTSEIKEPRPSKKLLKTDEDHSDQKRKGNLKFPEGNTQAILFPEENTQIKLFPGENSQIKLFPEENTQIKLFPGENSQIKLFPKENSQTKLFPKENTQTKKLLKEILDVIEPENLITSYRLDSETSNFICSLAIENQKLKETLNERAEQIEEIKTTADIQKIQLDTYREDFLQERRDRENIHGKIEGFEKKWLYIKNLIYNSENLSQLKKKFQEYVENSIQVCSIHTISIDKDQSSKIINYKDQSSKFTNSKEQSSKIINSKDQGSEFTIYKDQSSKFINNKDHSSKFIYSIDQSSKLINYKDQSSKVINNKDQSSKFTNYKESSILSNVNNYKHSTNTSNNANGHAEDSSDAINVPNKISDARRIYPMNLYKKKIKTKHPKIKNTSITNATISEDDVHPQLVSNSLTDNLLEQNAPIIKNSTTPRHRFDIPIYEANKENIYSYINSMQEIANDNKLYRENTSLNLINDLPLINFNCESKPDSTPESISESIPDSMPELILESIPESTPDSTPESISESIPESMPELILESIPESIPESTTKSRPDSHNLNTNETRIFDENENTVDWLIITKNENAAENETFEINNFRNNIPPSSMRDRIMQLKTTLFNLNHIDEGRSTKKQKNETYSTDFEIIPHDYNKLFREIIEKNPLNQRLTVES